MRPLLRRALSALLGLAVVAGLAVLAPSPAQATNATCTTSSRWVASHRTWGVPEKLTFTYGEYFRLSGTVDGVCTGNTNPVQGNIWAGDTHVQASYDRGTTWTTVQTESGPGVWWEGTWAIDRSVWLRMSFTGGRSYANDTWAPSVSPVVKLKVRRHATLDLKQVRGSTRAKVAIAPAKSVRGLRVAVQVKQHGRWRTVQRPTASRRGVAVARLPRLAKGTPVRVVLPAARHLARSVVRP
ncbi:hypothetical protein [Nocardioides nitrophenolicus]|uniref:hypothetical protein n=1 Tax=Nocardioides nitrophenolicus TaxID=60489 RepID=UPI00195AE90D|nr:hypothetical protein [Nocardioides nitrophenolicus]MBM7515792.1 hypothetical protein [Nocardioides nitrophenolicus]